MAVGNQELLDTLLALEARLDEIDRRRPQRDDGVPNRVSDLNQLYLRLTNQMRETSAALDYCLKVNGRVAELQAEGASRVLEMVQALDRPADGPPG